MRGFGAWAKLALAITVGLALGIGAYTFLYAKGYSYITNDPAACANCHVMNTQFDAWAKGPHHAVAVCNDCHLPHDNAVHKLYVKASNGYHHSEAFTLMNFAEPIRIKPSNARVLEANCLRCHGAFVDAITSHGTLGVPTDPEQQADLYGCVRCHQEVGHGPTR